MSSNQIYICDITDVAEESVIQAETNDLLLAIYNLAGKIYVTDDKCTHGPGLLSDGEICDGKIECDFHNGEFDIKTGEPVTAPCMIPIKTYQPLINGGKIFIEVEEE